MGDWLGWWDAALREAVLFAGLGILIGGIDELAVDAAYLLRLLAARLRGQRAGGETLADLPRPATAGRFALFVGAWDESGVIERMLRHTLGTLRHGDYRLYVGCYPNDPATLAAAASVARDDARVRIVMNPRPGPTTKADNLNAMWRALDSDDPDRTTRAVILHDAEDWIHPAELCLFDALLETHDVVQIPVVPLPQPDSRFVAGHYDDEFAESHSKTLVVRELVGAGLPLAGVGCAIAPAFLRRLADEQGGLPFAPDSLTEDYELGLRLRTIGARMTFARVRAAAGAEIIAVREYFPRTFMAAVRQKARWMQGIALLGWDRIGWGDTGHLGEAWMRWRDRRAPLAMLVTATAYVALLQWAVSLVMHAGLQRPAAPFPDWLLLVVRINTELLAWRIAARAWFTGRLHGWRGAVLAPFRLVTANAIALCAAPRALWRYVQVLAGEPLRWDKTVHAFPDAMPDE